MGVWVISAWLGTYSGHVTSDGAGNVGRTSRLYVDVIRPTRTRFRPRLPRRAQARPAVVREVARRSGPAPETARARMDEARASAGRLLHEDGRPGGARRDLGRRPARSPHRSAHTHRGRLRRSRRRVPAMDRARSSAQAEHPQRLPLCRQRPPAAGLRPPAARGGHDRGGRRLARAGRHRTAARQQDRQQGACRAARHLRARAQALRPSGEPGGRGREAAAQAPSQYQRLQRRGGVGARARGSERAGRRAVPHRRVHRSPHGRADRASLAGRRLRPAIGPGQRELHARRARRARRAVVAAPCR